MATVTVTTNADRLGDLIEELVKAIDFTMPGEHASLGEDLVAGAASGIADRSATGVDPDGAPWADNEPRYAAYKAARYGVHQVGELGGQMLSLESLKGKAEIGPDAIRMTYGTGDTPPSSSRSGTPLRPSERTATDKEKADHFEESGRRFYELDETIAEELRQMTADAVDKLIEAGGW